MAEDREFAPALDEIVWQDPIYAAQDCQGIHDNSGMLYLRRHNHVLTNLTTVLFYFQASPFFDQTSNNGILFTQAQMNEKLWPLLATRQAFEGRLRTMAGIEFMVAQEPAETAPGTGTGVWVIRKQRRTKRQGEEDEIAVLASYFVVGLNIYMASSIADILTGRLVGNKFTIANTANLSSYLSLLR